MLWSLILSHQVQSIQLGVPDLTPQLRQVLYKGTVDDGAVFKLYQILYSDYEIQDFHY